MATVSPLLHAKDVLVERGAFTLGPATIRLKAGERLSILGTSGSGKTTLLEVLGGHLAPTSGQIAFEGKKRSVADQLLRGFDGIAYLDQGADLPRYQTVTEVFAIALKHFPSASQQKETKKLLADFYLTKQAGTQTQNLSFGQRQRCALAVAIASNARLILLDEPFSHQDALMRQHLLGLLLVHLAKHATALLLSTHTLEDALLLTDRVSEMRAGKLRTPITWQRFLGSGKAEHVAHISPVALLEGKQYEVSVNEVAGSMPLLFSVSKVVSLPGRYLAIGTLPNGQPQWVYTAQAHKKGDAFPLFLRALR